ncbi:LysR family transcriptional regulator [Allopusillimonas soli]|uniref:LysR family transcriptional regulator n=1 Tax=Allopusillimonas soli TaxID=659016 RepID=A0A853F5P8_9BURK|nr:LysR family transcriptional regulator [Allopusillimonas soli]NYT35855.1 LysR family transcriptional regulator [Allopusillimonas soli]TEA76757.1 LysR family transcriptional regulator [Allopusillimonas soli]
MKGLDIPLLEIFVAAVEEKSLSRAAERENLVTSAVSKRITELERHLDRALLLRHGRGVEPTPAGTLLYQRAKAILKSVQLAETAIHSFSNAGVAKIRLAANPSTLLQFLPGPMGKFLHGRDDITVDLIQDHSYDIPRTVAEGKVDLGIYHAEHPATGVTSFPYARDRVGLVVPLGHPLADRGSLFLEDALDYDLLGYFPLHSLDKFLAYIGQTVSRPPTVKLQVANFETRCRMIREGLGIGIVAENIARNYLGSMGLVLLRLKDAWADRQFHICMHNAAACSPAALELLHFLCPSAKTALSARS